MSFKKKESDQSEKAYLNALFKADEKTARKLAELRNAYAYLVFNKPAFYSPPKGIKAIALNKTEKEEDIYSKYGEEDKAIVEYFQDGYILDTEELLGKYKKGDLLVSQDMKETYKKITEEEPDDEDPEGETEEEESHETESTPDSIDEKAHEIAADPSKGAKKAVGKSQDKQPKEVDPLPKVEDKPKEGKKEETDPQPEGSGTSSKAPESLSKEDKNTETKAPSGNPEKPNEKKKKKVPGGKPKRRPVASAPFVSKKVDTKELVKIPEPLIVIPKRERKKPQATALSTDVFMQLVESKKESNSMSAVEKRISKNLRWNQKRMEKAQEEIKVIKDIVDIDALLKKMPKFDTNSAYVEYLSRLGVASRVEKDERAMKKRTENKGDIVFSLRWYKKFCGNTSAKNFDEIKEKNINPAYFELCDMMPGINTGTWEQRICVALNHFKLRNDKKVYSPTLGNKTTKVAMTRDQLIEQYESITSTQAQPENPVGNIKAQIMMVILAILKEDKTLSEDFFRVYSNTAKSDFEEILKRGEILEKECLMLNKPGKCYFQSELILELISKDYVPWYTPVWEVILWKSRNRYEVEEKINKFIISMLEKIKDDDKYGKQHVKDDISFIRSRGIRQLPVAGPFTRFMRQICSDLRKITSGRERPRFLYNESPFKKKKTD